jgi:pullulanase
MKKYIFIVLLLLTTAFSTIIVKANDIADTLIIHYYRYDGDYTNWNAYLWNEKGASDVAAGEHFFENTDAWGAYVSVDLSEANNLDDATTVGIIIKLGTDWNVREFSYDRFINLETAEVNGSKEIHAYLVQDDENIGTSQDDLDNFTPDKRNRVLTAAFDESLDIDVTLTSTALEYTVYESGNVMANATPSGTSFNVPMTGVDITKTYTIEVEFSDVTRTIFVSKENIYDTDSFIDAYTYNGELGAIYSETSTTFRLWAPLSEAVAVNIYEQNHSNYDNDGNYIETPDTAIRTESMTQIENGAWEVVLNGDFSSKYYTFDVTNDGVTNEVVDPYAYSTGVNGQRGMVVDFDATDPINWVEDYRPNTILNMTDYTVYELHVRDLTTHETWEGNDDYRGTFLGLSEKETTYTEGDTTVTTGLDHIVELGVNAVQLLPIFDFGVVDETRLDDPTYDAFNWGYMPLHFNTLEGSYSTNPYNGNTRITEFKTAVQAFHDEDIRVIMDVVYNHTGLSGDSNFNLILPGYYHRMTSTGGFSNGSGTGNETASERSMMRKFMVDSVTFLATEYNLSGFRFDLMALHDVDTMNAIRAAVNEIDPTIVLYGEPWNGGTTPLSDSDAAGKSNIVNLDDVGAFSDTTRNGIKGSVFNANEGGWLQSQDTTDMSAFKDMVNYGITGGLDWDGVNVDAWHQDPEKIVNYVTAHDNHTLYDKLKLSGVSRSTIPYVQQEANAIVLTSQGIPFLHAGVEFLRTKNNDENSYESGDEVNQLDWSRKIDYLDTFNYYKGMIALRNIYENFRMSEADDIYANLTFYDTDDYTIAYKITGERADVIVIHVAEHPDGFSGLTLDDETYYVLSNHYAVDLTGNETVTGEVYVPSYTTTVLTNTLLERPLDIPNPNPENDIPIGLFIGISAGVLVIAGAVSFIILRKRKI